MGSKSKMTSYEISQKHQKGAAPKKTKKENTPI